MPRQLGQNIEIVFGHLRRAPEAGRHNLREFGHDSGVGLDPMLFIQTGFRQSGDQFAAFIVEASEIIQQERSPNACMQSRETWDSYRSGEATVIGAAKAIEDDGFRPLVNVETLVHNHTAPSV